MERIEFKNVVPQVFARRERLDSGVWQQAVTFNRGESCLVEADSGRGKSTFCSYVLGYRQDYSGSISFDGQSVRSLSVADWVSIRQHNLSCLFQELRLFPELTAYENVDIKNRLTRFKTRDEVMAWFEMLGIADKVDTKVGRMSFGQQQRVAMIRALVQPFDFLLADEPISHLDDANAQVMADIMMAEVHRQGAGLIVTSIGKHLPIAYDRGIQL